MPLTVPLPPGNSGITQLITNLEDAIARGDTINANRYRTDLTSALGAAYQYGVFQQGEQVALEIEGIIAAAGAWLQQRVAAGPGGQGITAVAPPPDAVSYTDALTQGTAQVQSLIQSQLRDIYARATAGDARPGETWRQLVARLYAQYAGAVAPANLLLEFPDTAIPQAPGTLSTSLAPASGAGTPDPWEAVVPSDYGALPDPTFFPDPTLPKDATEVYDIDSGGPRPSPSDDGTEGPLGGGAPGVAPADGVASGPVVDEAMAEDGLGQEVVRRNVALPGSGVLSTISAKVVVVVLLIVVGLYFVTRKDGG